MVFFLMLLFGFDCDHLQNLYTKVKNYFFPQEKEMNVKSVYKSDKLFYFRKKNEKEWILFGYGLKKIKSNSIDNLHIGK
jgi:hypothetical protein